MAAAITASEGWGDRLLGGNQWISLRPKPLWLATGNNPRLSNEMARRTVRIRLDAGVERPFERRDFKYPDLRTWVRSNRSDLVWASLTLIRAWLAAGRPECNKSLGGFESWSSVIGGVLEIAGVPGFLANSQEFYDTADQENVAWRKFIEVWWEQFHDRQVGTKELFPLAEELLDLGDKSERSQQTRLGKKLGTARDRVFCGYRVLSCSVKHQANQWKLMPVDIDPTAGEGEREGSKSQRSPDVPLGKPASGLDLGNVGNVGNVFEVQRTCAHARAQGASGWDHVPHVPTPGDNTLETRDKEAGNVATTRSPQRSPDPPHTIENPTPIVGRSPVEDGDPVCSRCGQSVYQGRLVVSKPIPIPNPPLCGECEFGRKT